MPGYCVQGTVGHKILNGAKVVDIDKQSIQVRLAVEVSASKLFVRRSTVL